MIEGVQIWLLCCACAVGGLIAGYCAGRWGPGGKSRP